MQIHVKTDNHIEGSDDLTGRVEDVVTASLDRFGDLITRVEVHLNDVNAQKHGVDKRCMMEARVSGRESVVVTHMADSLDDAIHGAADKLEKTLDRTVEKITEKKGRTSFGGDQTI